MPTADLACGRGPLSSLVGQRSIGSPDGLASVLGSGATAVGGGKFRILGGELTGSHGGDVQAAANVLHVPDSGSHAPPDTTGAVSAAVVVQRRPLDSSGGLLELRYRSRNRPILPLDSLHQMPPYHGAVMGSESSMWARGAGVTVEAAAELAGVDLDIRGQGSVGCHPVMPKSCRCLPVEAHVASSFRIAGCPRGWIQQRSNVSSSQACVTASGRGPALESSSTSTSQPKLMRS